MDQSFAAVVVLVACSFSVFGVILMGISWIFIDGAKKHSQKGNNIDSQVNLIAGSIIYALAFICIAAGVLAEVVNELLLNIHH